MGLLDYYKQFEALSDEEVSQELRARAEERRRRALARIDSLDLSKTTWHEFPHPDVVAAVTFAIRRGINRAPDAEAHGLRHHTKHGSVYGPGPGVIAYRNMGGRFAHWYKLKHSETE